MWWAKPWNKPGNGGTHWLKHNVPHGFLRRSVIWLLTGSSRLKHRQVVSDHAEAIREATVFDLQARYWEHERLLRQAEAVVEALGEPTRTIVRLCYFEQNTYRAVAERLGISPDTVKKHISKALRALREALGKKGDER